MCYHRYANRPSQAKHCPALRGNAKGNVVAQVVAWRRTLVGERFGNDKSLGLGQHFGSTKALQDHFDIAITSTPLELTGTMQPQNA